jgi:glycosyltransferase involved in cell wall biosynthesis
MTTYDILLLPNLSGEQPRVLFDAMANGVLAIASDIVSLSDLITNDHNGILCDPRDPDSFAVAVERLYLNKKILEPLLYNGMLTARQNTIESMHEKRKSVIQATFY